ncbi:hypothetical protein DFH28DRAFT_27512 [Melampsora americana]|nr:hypothetical protein DFH28DRAFT_27512 [Melampsora americana]
MAQNDHSQERSEAYQLHITNILSDSNLPIGGFVSSSGLESYLAHSFITTDTERTKELTEFARLNVINYASLSIPFMNGIFKAIEFSDPEGVVESVMRLDRLYHAMCLNPVTRRSSLAQGSAMVTLYTKSFSSADQTVIDVLKTRVRASKRNLHFPIAYALTSGLLGLSFARSIDLHLFLYVRSILSAAVRLNLIGPYLSQRILFSDIRPMLDIVMDTLKNRRLSKADQIRCGLMKAEKTSSKEDGHAQIENDEDDDSEGDEVGATTTWPLGDILSARHDLCHVRLFNS